MWGISIGRRHCINEWHYDETRPRQTLLLSFHFTVVYITAAYELLEARYCPRYVILHHNPQAVCVVLVLYVDELSISTIARKLVIAAGWMEP